MKICDEKSACKLMVKVPASSGNLGSAFDSAGVALQLYLTVEAVQIAKGPNRIFYSGEDYQPGVKDEDNFFMRSIRGMAEEHGLQLPFFELHIRNEIPIAKGMGSSAAALLAAGSVVDFLCGADWNREKLLSIVVAWEGHPDNAAPAIWGGLVASISSNGKIWCSKSPFPLDWTIVAVTPEIEIKTELARSVLPVNIPREHAVFNLQRVAFLISQLAHGRSEGLREAMADALHQPYRCALLPGLREALEIEDREGLLGISLSGAGSTVIAFVDSHEVEIGKILSDIFARNGLSSRIRFLKADNSGLVSKILKI